MQILKVLKNFWFFGASYFAAITSLMCLVSLAIPNKAILSERLLLILLLSFIMSLGSTVYRLDGINKTLAVCLHAAIYNVGFFFFFLLLWENMSAQGEISGNKFVYTTVATLIFAVIYVISTIATRMVTKAFSKPTVKAKTKSETKNERSARQKNRKEGKQPYKSQFS